MTPIDWYILSTVIDKKRLNCGAKVKSDFAARSDYRPSLLRVSND